MSRRSLASASQRLRPKRLQDDAEGDDFADGPRGGDIVPRDIDARDRRPSLDRRSSGRVASGKQGKQHQLHLLFGNAPD